MEIGSAVLVGLGLLGIGAIAMWRKLADALWILSLKDKVQALIFDRTESKRIRDFFWRNNGGKPELHELRDKIGELMHSYEALEAERKALRDDVVALRTSVDNLTTEVRKANARVGTDTEEGLEELAKKILALAKTGGGGH